MHDNCENLIKHVNVKIKQQEDKKIVYQNMGKYNRGHNKAHIQIIILVSYFFILSLFSHP